MEMQEVRLKDYMGTDLTVVNAARVSFSKESDWDWEGVFPELKPTDQKLIRYLAKHKHLSPFGHCFMSFHIKAPVFVRAQLVKHEYLRMNEVSRRYVDFSPELYRPDIWREKSENKKQGSGGPHPTWHSGSGSDYIGIIEEVYESALNLYNDMIEDGIAPEQARMVLPQAMMTEWWWSGSLDAFANMYNLRAKPDAQAETRYIAERIGEEAKAIFPHSWAALTESDDAANV